MNIGQTASLFLTLSIYVIKGETTKDFLFKEQGECASLLQDFAVACADFMLCSVSNARPIRICASCVKSYNDVMDSHSKIFQTGESPNTSCIDKFINLDRLEIFEAGYSFVQDLWNKGQCRNCFIEGTNNSLPFELSNSTKEFQKLYLDTNQCLQDKYNSSTKTYDPNVCNICSEKYCQMNGYYSRLKESLGDGQLCMDIVDTMNTTQNLWSNVLHCGETIMTTEIPLLVSTSIFLLLPVIFYFCFWRFGTATPSAVSVQKRLSQRFKERWRSRTGSTASHFR